MAHDIFISYSTKDKTIADAVCAKLEENKIRAWIAPRDVPAGNNFAQSIIQAINTCQVFVLIWSANTNTSNHILNEINQAFDRGKTIIPFRIQDIQPTDEMRYYIGRTHWLDAIDPPLENHINTLRDTILVNIGRELQPPPPAQMVEESPIAAIKPLVEPSPEKEPVSMEAGGVKPPVSSPPRDKSRKTSPESRPRMAASPNLSKYIPYAAGGLVVLTLGVLLISGILKGSPPTEVAEPLPSLTANLPPTKTTKPSATSTPIPAWVTEANTWAEPLLAAVQGRSPDFEDDFSQVDFRWYYSQYEEAYGHVLCANTDGAKMSTTEGSIKFGLVPSCQQGSLTHPDLQYSDYILQMDVNFNQTSGEFALHQFLSSKRYDELYFSIDPSRWAFTLYNFGDNIDYMEGGIDLDPSRPVTFTIINQSPNFLAYLNSILVVSYNDLDEGSVPGGMFFIMRNDDPKLSDTFELDNIKIWDLDKLN